jgi:hypothetical protein
MVVHQHTCGHCFWARHDMRPYVCRAHLQSFVCSPMNVSAESRDMSCVVHCDVGPVTVRLGAGSVEVDPNFRLYMVTRLANPTYLPEASTMVNVVNFTITRQVRLHLPSAPSPISAN